MDYKIFKINLKISFLSCKFLLYPKKLIFLFILNSIKKLLTISRNICPTKLFCQSKIFFIFHKFRKNKIKYLDELATLRIFRSESNQKGLQLAEFGGGGICWTLLNCCEFGKLNHSITYKFTSFRVESSTALLKKFLLEKLINGAIY